MTPQAAIAETRASLASARRDVREMLSRARTNMNYHNYRPGIITKMHPRPRPATPLGAWPLIAAIALGLAIALAVWACRHPAEPRVILHTEEVSR